MHDQAVGRLACGGQCQANLLTALCLRLCLPAAVLTLLSCISANTRARAALSHCSARTKLLQFGQTVGDARLRARALSLVKVLNKQDLVLHT